MESLKIIYRILRTLERGLDCEEFDPDQISAAAVKASDPRWSAAMIELVSLTTSQIATAPKQAFHHRR